MTTTVEELKERGLCKTKIRKRTLNVGKKKKNMPKFSIRELGWISVNITIPETLDQEIEKLLEEFKEKLGAPATKHNIYYIAIRIGVEVLKHKVKYLKTLVDLPFFSELPNKPKYNIWEDFYKTYKEFYDNQTLDRWYKAFEMMDMAFPLNMSSNQDHQGRLEKDDERREQQS